MKCVHCGSNRFVKGLVSLREFQPDRVRFLSLTSVVYATSYACSECGFIQMFVDPQKLAKILEK